MIFTLTLLFAILQKYDFSSKSQPIFGHDGIEFCCLRYCKSTIFQANHNLLSSYSFLFSLFAILQKYDFSSKSQQCWNYSELWRVVCDTAKVRFFKQITTMETWHDDLSGCLRYCKSTIFQANHNIRLGDVATEYVVCDTAKVRFFKQITTIALFTIGKTELFAILQKYDFSSKSQPQYQWC